MKCRLAVVLFACALVLGCGKTNDPPAGMGGDGHSPNNEKNPNWGREGGDKNQKKGADRNP